MTKAQKTVYDFIKIYIKKNGWSPDYKDISDGTGYGIEWVKKLMKELKEKKVVYNVKKNELRVK